MAPRPGPHENPRKKRAHSSASIDSPPSSPQECFQTKPVTGIGPLKSNLGANAEETITTFDTWLESPTDPRFIIDHKRKTGLTAVSYPDLSKPVTYPKLPKRNEQKKIELLAYPPLDTATVTGTKVITAATTPPSSTSPDLLPSEPSPKLSRFDFEAYRSLHNSLCHWVLHRTEKLVALYEEDTDSTSTPKKNKKEKELRESLQKGLDGLQFIDKELLNDYTHNAERSINIKTEQALGENKSTLLKASQSLSAIEKIEHEIKKNENETSLKKKTRLDKYLKSLKKGYIHELILASASLNGIGGELLPYDRQRLLGRLLYKPYESYLAFTASGLDSLAKAFPALATSLDTTGYHNFQNVAHGFKQASIWVMLAGLGYMCVDAIVQLVLPFFRRRWVVKDALGQRSVVMEPLEAVKERRQNWKTILKAKLLERGRWLALAFTVLITVSLIVTKVVLNGSFLMINAIHLAGKAIYAGISCGILGFKWARQKKIIEHLENIGVENALDLKKEHFKLAAARLTINPKNAKRVAEASAIALASSFPDKTDELKEIDAVKQSKQLQKEIKSIEHLERATNNPHLKGLIDLDKTESVKKEDEKKKPFKLGKANFFFLLPTFLVPLLIAWIIRLASKGKKCDFLVAQKTKTERKLEALSILEPLRVEKRKIAEGFRQKIFCLGIKITLLTGLVITACSGIPPLTIGLIFLTYGLAHGTYEIVRCFMKGGKWKKLGQEVKHAKEDVVNSALIFKSFFTRRLPETSKRVTIGRPLAEPAPS